MSRIGTQGKPVRALRCPGLGNEARLRRRHARAAARDVSGQCLHGAEAREAHRLPRSLQPLPVTRRRLVRFRIVETETFDVDECTDALGHRAGVKPRDVSAHAVTDEPHGCRRAVLRQQVVEIGKIIRKPVTRCPVMRPPEAPPVRCDDVPARLQRVDHELERRPRVAPAVQEHDQRIGRVAPLVDVVIHAAHAMRVAARRNTRPVH